MPVGQPRIRRKSRPVGAGWAHYRALPRLFRRRRLLIIGCGDIGRRLAALSVGAWKVYGVARSAASLDRIRAAGAVPLSADAPKRRLQDLADWVVHSAPPASDALRPGGGNIDALTRAWTTRLLQSRGIGKTGGAAGHSRCKRLVYLSTTGVYGDRQGRSTDEVCAVDPITDRARRRVDAERTLRNVARANAGLRVSILRVPGIYAIDRLPIRRLQERLPVLLPQDDVNTNHIEAGDLARLARVALMRFRSQRVVNVVDDSALPMGEYFDMVARWAGLPLPPRVDRETLLASVSPMRATFMSESRRLSNRRMKQELRVKLRYPTVADFLVRHEPPNTGSRDS